MGVIFSFFSYLTPSRVSISDLETTKRSHVCFVLGSALRKSGARVVEIATENGWMDGWKLRQKTIDGQVKIKKRRKRRKEKEKKAWEDRQAASVLSNWTGALSR